MKDILDQIQDWLSDGQSVALATVIRTWGSSPRPIGAGMAVSGGGQIAGSVSGGCVEGAVIDRALEVIRTQVPERLHFGVADADAWEVGLACGGEIEIFVRPFSGDSLVLWQKAYRSKTGFRALLLVEGSDKSVGQELIWIGGRTEIDSVAVSETNRELFEIAGAVIHTNQSGLYPKQGEDGVEFFLQIEKPPPQLVIVGGVQIAIPLVNLAEVLGFEITVIDPRRLFSSPDRFPAVKLISKWPSQAFQEVKLGPSSAVVMLTHDPKIDDPAIITALESPAFYVGALGSQKTHQKRLQRLMDAGVDPDLLARIHAPVGLDLGGRTPPEIALSVMAEIIKVWNTPTE